MTYAAVAIVKDEAEVIAPCLESLRPLIFEWFVLDTGSTDGTQIIVREALDGVRGRLAEAPFVDFGHSRSQVFAEAARFATADWLIATDADMTWEIDADFEPDPSVDAYMIKMGSADFEYRLPLLLNARKQWQSIGAVHEYTALIDGSLGVRVNTDKVRVTTRGDRSSAAKSEWHATLLEGNDDPRSVFYLAQTYRDLGRLDEARMLYERRATMGGYEEERWYAQFRAAALLEWPARLPLLMAAWEARPHRLEPLYELVVELNRRNLHQAAYALTARYALHTDDALFVHRSVWNWGMDFEHSIAAWWVGQYDEAERLGHWLLTRAIPDNVREAIIRNLALGERQAA